MASGNDVLAFTEFYARHPSAASFRETLHDGGWIHQATSPQPSVRANQVLLAARQPFEVIALPESPADEHLTSNAMLVKLGEDLSVLFLRMPTYQGTERALAWNYVSDVATRMAAQGAAAIMGDLNTSQTSKRPVPQFVRLINGTWTRIQPSGTGSYRKSNGTWHEIDHVLTTPDLLGAARYINASDTWRLAEGKDALSDHSALEVRLTRQSASGA